MAGDSEDAVSKLAKAATKRKATAIPPTIAQAIIEIQLTLKPMIKRAENASFDSSYVPLEDVVTKAVELLARRGVGLTQNPITDESGHSALETMLFTASGSSFSRVTKIAVTKIDPQAHGSAITYMRRYALMAMLGLTGEGEDDDGNKASGVRVPVSQEQIEEVTTLLKHLKWPRKSIASEVFNLKTHDAATLAIQNYREMVSQRVRDDESKANATKIEVSEELDETLDTPQGRLQARITALGLASPSYENKLVFQVTRKPFLVKVTSEEDLKKLSSMLTSLEEGKYALPAEFYAPRSEPITVNEPIA